METFQKKLKRKIKKKKSWIDSHSILKDTEIIKYQKRTVLKRGIKLRL